NPPRHGRFRQAKASSPVILSPDAVHRGEESAFTHSAQLTADPSPALRQAHSSTLLTVPERSRREGRDRSRTATAGSGQAMPARLLGRDAPATAAGTAALHQTLSPYFASLCRSSRQPSDRTIEGTGDRK